MEIRKARLQDASNIYELVNSLSSDGTLLRRAFAEICENVRDFTVAESAQGKGTGGLLLQSLLDEAEQHGVGCVCLFTRIPDFFFKHGFRVVEDRTALPDKIYKDCQNCPRLYRCDEVAMARVQIPRVSILGPRIEAEQLVRLTG